MKTYDVRERMTTSARNQIKRFLTAHAKYSKSYFWTPGRSADWRRRNESKFAANVPDFDVLTSDGIVCVRTTYGESCHHCYYSCSITLSNRKKSTALLKKMIETRKEARAKVAARTAKLKSKAAAELREALASEHYERAAVLRDRIRKMPRVKINEQPQHA